MMTHEITEWITDLDRAHALVRAAQRAASRAETDAVACEALEVLAELHGRMLRAEVRVVIANSSARKA